MKWLIAIGISFAFIWLIAPYASADTTELVEKASQYGTVESAEEVPSTTQAARSLVKSKASVLEQASAQVVLLKGHFVYTAHVKPGAKAPEGVAMLLTVTEGSTRMELLRKVPKLAKLGAPKRVAVAHTARISRHVKARAAKWDGCGVKAFPVNEHCYSITTWWMTGSERVRGFQCEVDTSNMFVYDWAEGSVSNECWTGFPSKGEWWEEVGTFSGTGWQSGPVNCCQLNWFVAWKQGAGQASYGEQDYVGALPANQWIYYSTKYEGNGVWCVWTGAPNWGTKWNCVAGYPSSSTELQAGAEYGNEVKPVNSGAVVTNGQFMNGSYYPWISDQLEHNVPGTCISRYWPNTHGDINFGTC